MTTSTIQPRTFTANATGGCTVTLHSEPYPKSPNLHRYRWSCTCGAVEPHWHRDCHVEDAMRAAKEHAQWCRFPVEKAPKPTASPAVVRGETSAAGGYEIDQPVAEVASGRRGVFAGSNGFGMPLVDFGQGPRMTAWNKITAA